MLYAEEHDVSRHDLITLVLTVFFGTFSLQSRAAETARVSLLELYTSEGCNSCPPADRQVSALPRPQLVPEKLVVLAFHVDYWNYLGWTDRFAQRRFTERQQAMVRTQNLRTAYTPQLLLNGRDFRNIGSIENHVQHLAAAPAAYDLQLESKHSGNSLDIQVHATRHNHNAGPAELYIAVYENNLFTDVRAGENRGERLRHDYVVRTLIGPLAIPDGSLRWTDKIAIGKDWKPGDLGVAAFVQSARSGEVLQAIAREQLAR
jgi:hypothetical protein